MPYDDRCGYGMADDRGVVICWLSFVVMAEDRGVVIYWLLFMMIGQKFLWPMIVNLFVGCYCDDQTECG